MRRQAVAFTFFALPLAAALSAAHDASPRPLEDPARQDGRAAAAAQSNTKASSVQIDALDRRIDPCSDFYQFACGGWIGSHPAPADQPRYGRFNELQDRNNDILHDILENAAKPGAAPELRKIGDHYASCMAESAIEARGRAPLTADLTLRERQVDHGTATIMVRGTSDELLAFLGQRLANEQRIGSSVAHIRESNQRSAARHPISAQTPPIAQPVSTTSRRPVFFNDSSMMAVSSGLIVRRSMTSASIPSAASVFAAFSASSSA